MLDLSLDRIEATWGETVPVITTLRKKLLVDSLNLSVNYLSALETLNANLSVKLELYSYGR